MAKKKLRQIVREHQAAERQERAEHRRANPAKIVTLPKCKGCGTSVPDGDQFCEVCSERRKQPMTAPKASIETGPQRIPPYANAN